MAANTSPIYTGTPDVQWATPITTANTAKDGTGTVATVFTADATNGGYVTKIIGRPAGSNTASVARVFINNGQVNSNAANNTLIAEVSLPTTTLSEVAAITGVEIPLNFALPAGYKLLVTIGTTVAAGWAFSAIGGKY